MIVENSKRDNDEIVRAWFTAACNFLSTYSKWYLRCSPEDIIVDHMKLNWKESQGDGIFNIEEESFRIKVS